jgi:hypothetical protein
VKEVVEVLVGNRIARVGPGFHVSPPGVDHSPHIRVVSAVDSTQSAVDEIDIVLLSHRAALVGTAPYDVFVDVGAQSGSLILVSDGGVRLGLGTIASCERNDATRLQIEIPINCQRTTDVRESRGKRLRTLLTLSHVAAATQLVLLQM